MDMSVQKFLKRREVAEASRRLVRAYTTDGMMTYDQMTIDSTGAFLIGQLERLDQTLNEPLVEFTWSRDIDIREVLLELVLAIPHADCLILFLFGRPPGRNVCRSSFLGLRVARPPEVHRDPE